MSQIYRRQISIDQLLSNSSVDQKSQLSLGGLLSQAGINLAVCAGLLVVFMVLRYPNGAVYGRRYKHAPPDKKPPRLTANPFSWLGPLFRTGEAELLRTVGLDAVLLLRFLKLCFYTFLVFTAAGAGPLIPINYLKGVIAKGEEFGFGTIIARFNMTNMTELRWITADVVVAYALSVFLWLFIFLNNRFFIRTRQAYFHSEEFLTALHNRTLMITRLPAALRDDSVLLDYMSSLTPDYRVTTVSVGRELGELPKLVDRHTTLIGKLERVLASYLRDEASLDKPRPTVKVNREPVDAIAYYTEQLEDIQRTIKVQRADLHLNRSTNFAFIAYANAYEAQMALKTLAKAGTGKHKFLLNLAPAARDIIWANVVMPPAILATRKTIIRVLFGLFCCFATIPTSALSLITSVSSLRQLFPDSNVWFDSNPKIASFWQTLVTPLILAIYFMMLPFVFRLLSRYSGIHTHTAVERSVMKKMYIFLMFSQVVVFTLAGVLSNLIGQVNNKKLTVGQLFENLAPYIISSLSSTSTFWISYVALRCINNMLELTQVFSLFLIFTRRYFTKPTPRQISVLSKPPDFDYGVVYANYLFLFVMTLVYSVYAPLILPFGAVFFGLGVMVYKYQLMYVYITKVQTAGLMWRSVVNRMFVTIIMFQLFVLLSVRFRIADFDALGYMNQWSLCIPLPILTLIIAIAHYFWLEPRMRYMSGPPADDRFGDLAKENHRLLDRFLQQLFRDAETTPMVDKKVRHLLQRVYQTRQSMPPPGKDENGVMSRADGSVVAGTNLRYDFRDVNSDMASFAGDYHDTSFSYHSEYEMNTLPGGGPAAPGYPGDYKHGSYVEHESYHHPAAHLGYDSQTFPPLTDPAPTYNHQPHGIHHQPPMASAHHPPTRSGPFNPYQPAGPPELQDYPSQGFYHPQGGHHQAIDTSRDFHDPQQATYSQGNGDGQRPAM
ncbi:hypothetical protein IWQ60_007736, partial [Tieghemiomyces parasiticus]